MEKFGAVSVGKDEKFGIGVVEIEIGETGAAWRNAVFEVTIVRKPKNCNKAGRTNRQLE